MLAHFLHSQISQAALAVLLGGLTVLATVGLGRTCGLFMSLGYNSAVRVSVFRIGFDGLVCLALCFLLYRWYDIDGRLDLTRLGVTPLPAQVPAPVALGALLALFAGSYTLAFRLGRRQPPLQVGTSQMILRRSVFALDRYFVSERIGSRSKHRTVDEWLVSEFKCLIHFTAGTLTQGGGPVPGRLSTILEQAHMEVGSQHSQSGNGTHRGHLTGEGTGDSHWPRRPIGSILLLWCLALWTSPRWVAYLGPFALRPSIRGLGLGLHTVAWLPISLIGTVPQQHVLSSLDVLTAIIALMLVFLKCPPLFFRSIMIAIALLYVSVPICLLMALPSVPLWAVAMQLPTCFVLIRLTTAENTWVRTDAYSSRNSRGWGTAGKHFSLVFGICLRLVGISIFATIFAAMSFGLNYEITFIALLKNCIPLTVYMLSLHLLVLALTARRASPFDLRGPVTIAAWAGLAVSIALAFAGEIRWITQSGNLLVTAWPYSSTGGNGLGPEQAYWQCGPLLASAGFTIGLSRALLAPAGRWHLPQVRHIEPSRV